MRIAIVTDIHGNLTAFEAVLADIRDAAPDLILHGGDLSDSGSSPTEIIDRIRDLGWPGVYGNTDEMLFSPESLDRFAGGRPLSPKLLAVICEMAAWTRAALGEARIAWLRTLPGVQLQSPVALVHATPQTSWAAPNQLADEVELESLYSRLGQQIVVYGHIHHPYLRHIPGLTVVNAGSVGLPYDGDPRASYVLIDDATPTIRRVEYDVDREIGALSSSGFPHAAWVARMLKTATPHLP
jgi:putative phosphoesterase